VKAVLHGKQHGSIGNEEHQQLTGAGGRTVTPELGDSVERGVWERMRTTGRGTRYAAKKAEPGEGTASRDAGYLIGLWAFERVGHTVRGMRYVLKRRTRSHRGPEGVQKGAAAIDRRLVREADR
jgi:hypothetical protein